MRIALQLAAAALAATATATAQTGTFTTAESGCPTFTGARGDVLYDVLPVGGWSLDGRCLTYLNNVVEWALAGAGGGSFIGPSSGAVSLLDPSGFSDDFVAGPLMLPFSFSYPGGSTTMIDASSNGHVFLRSDVNNSSRCCSGTDALVDFLAGNPSVAVLGTDLNPDRGGAWTFDTQMVGARQVALVTWDGVPEYDAVGANTCQVQLWDDDSIVICHAITNGAASVNTALVGVSVGGGVADPGPTPLNPSIRLGIRGAPNIGELMTLTAENLPAGSATGAMQFGLGATNLPLSVIGAPAGCELLVDRVFISVPMVVNPPVAELTFRLPCNTPAVGGMFRVQGLFTDLTAAGSVAVPVFVSDRGTLTLGSTPALRFVCDGAAANGGNAAAGGFFRLESACSAAHQDITHLRLDLGAVAQFFDTDGTAAAFALGAFHHGNGAVPTACSVPNSFGGSDVTTGLVYGPPQLASACDASAFLGWTGSNVQSAPWSWNTIDMEFAPGAFLPGETLGFDCDIDGGPEAGGDILMAVTVTFSDGSTVSGTTVTVDGGLSELILIP